MKTAGLDSVKTYVSDYLRQNPKATETEVLVETKNYFQSNAKKSSLSKKQISQIAPVVSEVYGEYSAEQLKANVKPVTTPAVQNAVAKINSQEAQRHYDTFNSLSKTARQRLHKRKLQETKSAFAGDEYIKFLEEKHPELIEKQVPQISNNQNKKQANAQYLSSKKKKAAKKMNEQISKEEHARWRDTKPRRNAHYLTSQGQMTKEGKRIYTRHVNIQNLLENGIAPFHSAKESMQVFIENGLAPEIRPEAAKPAQAPKPRVTQKEVEAAAERTADTITNTVKKSHNKSIMAITAGIIGLGGLIFGYDTYKTNKEAS